MHCSGITDIQHTGLDISLDHANTMTLMVVDEPGGAGPFTYTVQAKLDIIAREF